MNPACSDGTSLQCVVKCDSKALTTCALTVGHTVVLHTVTVHVVARQVQTRLNTNVQTIFYKETACVITLVFGQCMSADPAVLAWLLRLNCCLAGGVQV